MSGIQRGATVCWSFLSVPPSPSRVPSESSAVQPSVWPQSCNLRDALTLRPILASSDHITCSYQSQKQILSMRLPRRCLCSVSLNVLVRLSVVSCGNHIKNTSENNILDSEIVHINKFVLLSAAFEFHQIMLSINVLNKQKKSLFVPHTVWPPVLLTAPLIAELQ